VIALKIIIYAYFALAISVVAHEFAHYLTIRAMHREIDKISIGVELFQIKLGSVYFSPLVFHGAIDVPIEQLHKMKEHEVVIFFLSGPFANVVLVAGAMIANGGWFCIFLAGINMVSAAASIIPFLFPQNDITNMLNILRQRRYA
jgi:Zn-dependent protease